MFPLAFRESYSYASQGNAARAHRPDVAGAARSTSSQPEREDGTRRCSLAPSDVLLRCALAFAQAPPVRQAFAARLTLVTSLDSSAATWASLVTTARPRGGVIGEAGKNAAKAVHTATVLPLGRGANAEVEARQRPFHFCGISLRILPP